MVGVVEFDQARARSDRVAFSREELRQLMNVYSRRVASGEWRDYAIDHGAGRAVFSIFRHTAEHPVYAIAKVARTGEPGYRLTSRHKNLIEARTITEVLTAIERRPRLVRSA